MVAVNVTAADFQILFGNRRAIIDPKTAQPAQQMALEWGLCISLPAPIAKQLSEALAKSAEGYVAQFGAIPVDSKAKIEMGMGAVALEAKKPA